MVTDLKGTGCRSVFTSYLFQQGATVAEVRAVLQGGMSGLWSLSDTKGNRTAKDGQEYSFEQFLQYYGNPKASREWQMAPPVENRRKRAADGVFYDYGQFAEYYGDQAPRKWRQSSW